MNKRKTSLVLGVVFGLYLIGFAICCFAISIVLAIAKDVDLTFTMFAFPVLGVTTIVGACFSKKSIVATRIIYLISTTAYVGTLILFVIMGLYSELSLLPVLFIVFAGLGITATVFAFLTKNENTKNDVIENN